MIPVVANGIIIPMTPPSPTMPALALPFDPPLGIPAMFNGFPLVTVPFTMGGFAGVAVPVSVSLWNGFPCLFVGSTVTLSNGYTCTVPASCGAGATVDVM